MLSLPLAALAVAAVLLGMNLGSSHNASADSGHAVGLEYSLAAPAGGGTCDSAPDGAGVCVITQGSNFVTEVTLSDISGLGNAAYVANAVTWVVSNQADIVPKFDATATWPECVFLAPAPPPNINVGCSVGVAPAPQSSTFTGVVATASFNCINSGTISLLHGPSDTLITDTKNVSHDELGPDSLTVTCAEATFTPLPTATSTPPPIPRMQKDCDADTEGVQNLCNVFLQRNGAKVPPVTCDEGTSFATLTEQINQSPVTFNPKGEAQDLAAFEFEVRFDPTKVCVNLAAAGDWVGNPDVICSIQDKDSSTLEGIARIGCVTIGKGVDTDGLILATIEVRPQPEVYSQLRPNQDNGNAIQILNQGCELADEQGHAIPIFSCEDADITFRYLEGDVDGPDCDVDVFDTQQVAFRWGVNKGSLLYNTFMDLEPSGQVKGDGDIDIKDIQFVFGRFGSTCDAPWPAQLPVNPKA